MWELKVVDPSGIEGSVILDSRENPHISYLVTPFDGTHRIELEYAFWTGANWNMSTVDPSIGTSHSSLVLDSLDHPHISYINGSHNGNSLIYASLNGSVWDKQIIDQGNLSSVSIALDSKYQPHLSYVKNDTLNYAKLNNSAWTIQTVDPQNLQFFSSYVALDTNDQPQIIYTELSLTKFNIRYASWTGSEWQVHTEFSNATIVGNVVLDSDRRVNLVYVRHESASGETLVYAYWNGSGWASQTVAGSPYPYHEPLIALDPLNKPHIFFYKEEEVENSPSEVVIYAQWSGSSWAYLRVFDRLSVSTFNGIPITVSSMVIDSHNRLHVTTFITVGTFHGALRDGNLTYATLENTSTISNSLFLAVATAIIATVVFAVLVLVYRKRKNKI